jgi:Arc/MetJ-type ribon-helix-helix transcriptional regulator
LAEITYVFIVSSRLARQPCIALRAALYYMSTMSTVTSRSRTITVRLPEALADEIETESRQRGVSKSDVVRERLERAREDAGSPKLPPHLERIADLIGSVDDDVPSDLTSRKKHYLRLWGYGRKRHR